MTLAGAREIVIGTNLGRVRTCNEDSLGVDAECRFVILADGMGGHNAGEVASRIAVTSLRDEMTRGLALDAVELAEDGVKYRIDLLDRSIRKANRVVLQEARRVLEQNGMGTTLVSVLFYVDHLIVGHVGDSRLYRLRGKNLALLTRDHSFLQEQIDCGMISVEGARHSQYKNLVTRAVGIEAEVTPEIHVHDVEQEDVYLLCSDGLNDMISDLNIQSILYRTRDDLTLGVEQLIQAANDQGGRDNISVILIKVRQSCHARLSIFEKICYWLKK